MSQKGKWSVDVAERVLDATQFRTGRVLPDDVAVGVRDQAGADQRRTVVDGADVGGDVERVRDGPDRLVREVRVDVRATVVGEHDVPGGVDAPRQFRHLDVDGVLD